LVDAGSRAGAVLGGYVVGTAAISLFGAATTAILMIVLGLPLALPIAVLAFVLGFIPYVGGFVSTILAFLVTVAVGEPSDIVIMAMFTIVFNIAQGNVVAPLVYGRTVSLHAAVVLLAIPAGNQLAGLAGMFLIVPLLGIVAATWRAALRVVDTDEALARLPLPDVAVTEASNMDVLPKPDLTLGTPS
jgi:predicted PurR-regulated permease PerM